MKAALAQWSPRILGVVVAMFAGAFSLDALREGPLVVSLHV